MARRHRQKNLSTGAWVAIAIGLGVVVPVVVIGGVMLYAVKRGTKLIDDSRDRLDDIPMEPDYGVPDTWQ